MQVDWCLWELEDIMEEVSLMDVKVFLFLMVGSIISEQVSARSMVADMNIILRIT